MLRRDIDIAILSVRPSVCPPACLSRSGIVSTRLNASSFPTSTQLSEIPTGPPPTGVLSTGGLYKFRCYQGCRSQMFHPAWHPYPWNLCYSTQRPPPPAVFRMFRPREQSYVKKFRFKICGCGGGLPVVSVNTTRLLKIYRCYFLIINF